MLTVSKKNNTKEKQKVKEFWRRTKLF